MFRDSRSLDEPTRDFAIEVWTKAGIVRVYRRSAEGITNCRRHPIAYDIRGEVLKGAIAAVEFFVSDGQNRPQRLSLAISAPVRSTSEGSWRCRVVLADRYPPAVIDGADSVDVLARALDQARVWITELRQPGHALTRDREGDFPFEL
ncbi:MAG TPA: hypothetical protein EYQ60_15550 [Myxococcales bacterium]|nr:hypothetical protein [Myxococcales bacterium]HIK85828.1 hypothetical protein [Myxococcales bacterium]